MLRRREPCAIDSYDGWPVAFGRMPLEYKGRGQVNEDLWARVGIAIRRRMLLDTMFVGWVREGIIQLRENRHAETP